MLSRRVGAAANTSVPGIPVSPINHVAWVFKLRQLLWQDVSMFAVVGMDVSFSLKKYGIQVSHAWNLKITHRVWTVLKMANFRWLFLNITTSQLDVFSFGFLFFQGFLSASVSAKLCLLSSEGVSILLSASIL